MRLPCHRAGRCPPCPKRRESSHRGVLVLSIPPSLSPCTGLGVALLVLSGVREQHTARHQGPWRVSRVGSGLLAGAARRQVPTVVVCYRGVLSPRTTQAPWSSVRAQHMHAAPLTSELPAAPSSTCWCIGVFLEHTLSRRCPRRLVTQGSMRGRYLRHPDDCGGTTGVDVEEQHICARLEELGAVLPHNWRADTIICTQVFEHVVDQAAAVRELSAALAPRGHIIWSAPFLEKYHRAVMH